MMKKIFFILIFEILTKVILCLFVNNKTNQANHLLSFKIQNYKLLTTTILILFGNFQELSFEILGVILIILYLIYTNYFGFKDNQSWNISMDKIFKHIHNNQFLQYNYLNTVITQNYGSGLTPEQNQEIFKIYKESLNTLIEKYYKFNNKTYIIYKDLNKCGD